MLDRAGLAITDHVIAGAGSGSSTAMDRTDPFETARAQQYGLLSRLLIAAPDADLRARLTQLPGGPSALEQAHGDLAQAAATSLAAIERDFFDLFVGVGRGKLLPYGSFYLTGFLHERPLARLRADLAVMGVERDDTLREPEDHAAILFDVMAGLARGRFDQPIEAQQRFFARHLQPWVGRFFADLQSEAGTEFYTQVGRVGGLFVEIEAQAFALDA